MIINRDELKAKMDRALDQSPPLLIYPELLEIILQARGLIIRLEFEIEHGYPYEGSGQQGHDRNIIKCFDETAGEE